MDAKVLCQTRIVYVHVVNSLIWSTELTGVVFHVILIQVIYNGEEHMTTARCSHILIHDNEHINTSITLPLNTLGHK